MFTFHSLHNLNRVGSEGEVHWAGEEISTQSFRGPGFFVCGLATSQGLGDLHQTPGIQSEDRGVQGPEYRRLSTVPRARLWSGAYHVCPHAIVQNSVSRSWECLALSSTRRGYCNWWITRQFLPFSSSSFSLISNTRIWQLTKTWLFATRNSVWATPSWRLSRVRCPDVQRLSSC